MTAIFLEGVHDFLVWMMRHCHRTAPATSELSARPPTDAAGDLATAREERRPAPGMDHHASAPIGPNGVSRSCIHRLLRAPSVSEWDEAAFCARSPLSLTLSPRRPVFASDLFLAGGGEGAEIPPLKSRYTRAGSPSGPIGSASPPASGPATSGTRGIACNVRKSRRVSGREADLRFAARQQVAALAQLQPLLLGPGSPVTCPVQFYPEPDVLAAGELLVEGGAGSGGLFLEEVHERIGAYDLFLHQDRVVVVVVMPDQADSRTCSSARSRSGPPRPTCLLDLGRRACCGRRSPS